MADREKILLVGFDRKSVHVLAAAVAAAGYVPFLQAWGEAPLRSLRRQPPACIVVNADAPDALPMEQIHAEAAHLWGEAYPLAAVTASRRFADLCALLDAGAAACFAPDAPQELMERKIASAINNGAAQRTELQDEVPPEMSAVFLHNPALVPLGSLVHVWPGAAPRRACWRRMAPPDQFWRGVISADNIARWQVGRTDTYLRWNKLCLFRVPAPEEYNAAEKVVVRRAGPPIAAAVDRSRQPAGMGTLALVPREAGVSAGFVACILNSRLADFYFNRVAPLSRDGYLAPDVLRRMPVPRPTTDVCTELGRAAALLAHYGPRPQTWIDRQSKAEWDRVVDDIVFGLYGVGSGIRSGLASMYF